MIVLALAREEDVDGTCDMDVNGSPCEDDAVIQFVEDGVEQRLCIEHGKDRIQTLMFSPKVWDTYAIP